MSRTHTSRSSVGRALLGAALAIVGVAVAAPALASFDHGSWNRILQAHVDGEGKVAYRSLAEKDRPALDAYLQSLAEADPTAFADDQQRLAFWINAYNAVAVAGILAGYHAESLFGRYRFCKSYESRVAGADRTLDEIEHEIIRSTFDDFRVHFAVNCASTSCPVLRDEAYVGERLDAQLDDQAKRFLADPSRNRFSAEEGSAQLSKIFEWFAEDFTKQASSLAAALAPYLDDRQRKLLESRPVRYLDYDWTMNAQAGQRP